MLKMLLPASQLIEAGFLRELCVAWSVLLIGAANAVAASTVWNDPANGDFLAGANWSLGAPESGDSAIFAYNFLSDGLYVTVPASSGIAGDYNNYGAVDATDYVVWRNNEGTNNTLPNNSIPSPIGLAHYSHWRANFGKPPASGANLSDSSNATVPEPATWVLGIALAACGALRRRGRIRFSIECATHACHKGA